MLFCLVDVMDQLAAYDEVVAIGVEIADLVLYQQQLEAVLSGFKRMPVTKPRVEMELAYLLELQFTRGAIIDRKAQALRTFAATSGY